MQPENVAQRRGLRQSAKLFASPAGATCAPCATCNEVQWKLKKSQMKHRLNHRGSRRIFERSLKHRKRGSARAIRACFMQRG